MPEPTNTELFVAFKGHYEDDARVHQEDKKFQGEMAVFKAETEGKLADLHSKVDALPMAADMENIIESVITRLLLNKGKLIYTGIIAVGGFAFAITAIFGGLKVIAGVIGLGFIHR